MEAKDEHQNAAAAEAKDVQPCQIDIVSLEVDWVNEVVFYNLRIQVPEEADNVLYLMKRYSQFYDLNKKLKEDLPRFHLPSMPQKELIIWTDHTDTRFVEERRTLLEYYLREALAVAEIRADVTMQDFLHSNEISSQVARTIEEQFEQTQTPDAMASEEMEVCEVWIPNTKKMRDHCLYQVHCRRGGGGEESDWNEWVILKRYRDFFDMDALLHEDLPLAVANSLPNLPERQSKIMVDHMDPDFIDQRRVLLDNYLKKLVRVPDLQHCPAFLKFLNVSPM